MLGMCLGAFGHCVRVCARSRGQCRTDSASTHSYRAACTSLRSPWSSKALHRTHCSHRRCACSSSLQRSVSQLLLMLLLLLWLQTARGRCRCHVRVRTPGMAGTRHTGELSERVGLIYRSLPRPPALVVAAAADANRIPLTRLGASRAVKVVYNRPTASSPLQLLCERAIAAIEGT